MGSTFSTLSASISGLFANKKALDTVSHNIANVDNKNYVRQQVIQASTRYDTISGTDTQLGTGVNIQEIRQIRDEFLDIKYRSHAEEMGYWTTRDGVFQEIQGIFNELSNSGLQNVMDQFWNSWEELSKHPDNLTMRGLLHERATAFVETINHFSTQLDNLQKNINTDIEFKVREVNDIAKKVAELNKHIIAIESRGVKANDYRDKRNQYLDRLSELANIKTVDDPSGAMNVLLGGQSLINKSNYREISAVKSNSSFVDVYWKDTLAGGFNLTPISEKVVLKSGELKGLIDCRGDVDTTIVGEGNGTINDEVDIVIAVDLTSNNLTEIENAIKNYRDDLTDRGLKPKFKLVTFYGDGSAADDPQDITGSFEDAGTFIVPALTPKAEPLNEDFGSVVSFVDSIADFRDDAHKKLIVFTDENIGGTGNVVTDSTVEGYKNTLNSLGVSTTVVSSTTHKYDGDINEHGWDTITHGTGGQFFDLEKVLTDNIGLAKDIAQETSNTSSRYMGNVTDYKEIIPSLKQKLNGFVNTIARNINYLHRQGTTLTGNSGDDFFVAANSNVPIEAGNIKLNPNLDILNNIAVSLNGEKGDGRIAEEIANVRSKYIFADMTGDDYYRDIISQLGVIANEASTAKESQEILLTQVDGKRKAISAVSLDEEMTNMLQYQHSYVANSRVVNAVDEMIDVIINRMGRVGR